MKSKSNHKSRLHITWLLFLVVALLVLGVFFRFVNLDRKVYWWDETYTSLRISGYTEAELVQQVFNGHEISIESLQKYQRPNPEKGLIDTIKSLAVEEPQHPPLYYVLARFWVQWFGNSVAVTRSLSALISLLVFPCVYWLCLELFKSSLTGWVAIAVIAVSPFHVLYAQEAREYSLWTVTILLSSVALLRAMRLKTKLSWGIYAATVALGLYSHLFFGFIIIGYGLYIVAIERFRLSKTFNAYVLASLAGLLAFAPWIIAIITNLTQVQRTTAWVSGGGRALSYLVKYWGLNISHVFLDINGRFFDNNWQLIYDKPTYFFLPILLILIGYSIYFLCRRTPKQVWLFILILMGTTALGLILPDVILGGGRSTISRYLIPCYLGIQLAVTYLLATQVTFFSVNTRRQNLWQLVMIMLVFSGVLSCTISSQAETWWNKSANYFLPQVSHIINQASHPLLICDYGDSIGGVLPISYLLDLKVRLVLLNQPIIPKNLDKFSDVFLYIPSKPLLDEIEKQQIYKVEPIYKLSQIYIYLWRLEKK